MLNLDRYRTLVLDCDGVILNSNHLKIEAYFATAKHVGATDEQAQSLVDYHIKLGGISRFVKFRYFLSDILQKPVHEHEVDALLVRFGQEVRQRLANCEIAPGLGQLREQTAGANWLVISGGDQQELRDLFDERGLTHYFDGGIFGSPDNKDEILAREIARDHIRLPALFLGDSQYDHESSTRAGLDFIFLSRWTDFPHWQEYTTRHHIKVHEAISSLVSGA